MILVKIKMNDEGEDVPFVVAIVVTSRIDGSLAVSTEDI